MTKDNKTNIFTRYSSIKNTYQQEQVDKYVQFLPNGMETLCQVTEKIHGANFSFYITANDIKIAKRSSFCETGFYDCSKVVSAYAHNLHLLFNRVHFDTKCKLIILYGELAGNGVLSGVNYGHKDFYVFDIKVDEVFILTTAITRLCAMYDLKHVPELTPSCSLRSALAMDSVFKSKIKETITSNWAEGIVIKPISPTFLPTGSRIMLKKKSPKFSETKTKKTVSVLTPLTLSDSDLIEFVCEYLTDNRLTNVLSKHGTPTRKEEGKILGLFVKDAREDFECENEIIIKDVAKEYKRVNSEIMRCALPLVNRIFND